MLAPCLIIAIGNESRGDDALGPLLLRQLQSRIEHHGLAEQFELIEEFQLQIEHTLDIAGRRLTLFVDAGEHTPAPFSFYRVQPKRLDGHTSHAVAPETLLGIYAQVHGETPPPAFVLCIAGKAFELGEPLSVEAMQHLDAAFNFACQLLACADLQAWSLLAPRS